jgi:hypothetical protein
MTITLKIDNSDMEEQLKLFVKEQKEITLETFNNFINSFQKQEKLVYKKKDPKKYSRIIQREYDPKDVDEVALLHIEDSAKYVHDLRREIR